MSEQMLATWQITENISTWRLLKSIQASILFCSSTASAGGYGASAAYTTTPSQPPLLSSLNNAHVRTKNEIVPRSDTVHLPAKVSFLCVKCV
jgi:hypothetical protein